MAAKKIEAGVLPDVEPEATPQTEVDVDGFQQRLDWFLKQGLEESDAVVVALRARLADAWAKRDAGKNSAGSAA